nr:BrnT family toxin [Rhodoferax sp.]
MNFEWGESKSGECFVRRGFDFAYAARAFFDPNRIVTTDTRRSYGEERYQMMGMIEQHADHARYALSHCAHCSGAPAGQCSTTLRAP